MARSTKGKESDSYVVHGRVSHSESGHPAAGMQVTAMDADLLFDDKLGTATTDRDGRFRITYGVEQFRDLFERAPDIYLVIHAPDGRLVTTTKDATIRNAGPDQEIEVQLPADPHAAKPTKDAKTIRREDHEETFRTAKITNNKVYFVTFETFVVSNVRGLGRRYSAAACSTGIG